VNGESPVAVVHRVCAWCGKEFARETWRRTDRDEVTTWGICRRCLEPRLDDGEVCEEAGGLATGENRSAGSA
jgi:hypothetical protein